MGLTAQRSELIAQIAALTSAAGILVTTVVYLLDLPLNGWGIAVFAVGSLITVYGGFFTAVGASTVFKEKQSPHGKGMMKLGGFLLGVFAVLGIAALMVTGFSRGEGVVGPSASIAVMSGAIGLLYVIVGYLRRVLKAVEAKPGAGN